MATTNLFIETRFFDNGSAEARISKTRPELPDGVAQNKFDYYSEEVAGTLQDWLLENLEIDALDTPALIEALDAGDWVNITKYV